ncbi:MAG: helicase-related protein [Acidobacteriota bacterium]
MSFTPGSLVRARGREWVVLPESVPEFLMLRPLGGTEDEVAGVCTSLEKVAPATFDLPDPAVVGDHRSCRLLRDAVRISSRAGAGPFRSFSRIAVEPRPYQLVPLLLALRQERVRLLIADDVGIGKTVEALLIARELLDRGELSRTAVLCPPHLAQQWQRDMHHQFHIDAELVLPSTVRRLESTCGFDQSLFERYPHVIVSMDFIKSDRRRQEFVKDCPAFVIVDEAHTCSFGYEGRGGRHQRNQLVNQLAKDDSRHLVLVTATPHSGNEEAFRSLLAFLNRDFANLPADLSGPANEGHRRRLAAHFVQRRRADIRHFLQTDTPFPDRPPREETYKLTPEYRRLFDRVLSYAREKVRDPSGGRHRQRVRWWSALALMRSLGSSPAAAAATLRNRASVADTATPEEADALGRRTVFDDEVDDLTAAVDVAPGADPGEEVPSDGAKATTEKKNRRLLEMAREAEKLAGEADGKLTKAIHLVSELIDDGLHPIVFCRFIPTVEYVTAHLRKALPKGTEVAAVTGLLAPAEREAPIAELGEKRAEGKKIVLVCTDCLSEGINLQNHFDAVIHYDLAWNPTRHEQREGRVDRFGQPRKEVRVLTYYGIDNQIDGIILDVLLRKHRAIRNSLGISVPVPVDTNQVVEAVFEGLLLREKGSAGSQDLLPGLEEYIRPRKQDLHEAWDSVAEREKRSRTMFAQESIHVDEVARELEAARRATGSTADVERFTVEALRAHGGFVTPKGDQVEIDLTRGPRALRDQLHELPEKFRGRFDLPVDEGVLYLSRTHPLIEGLATHVMDTALDPVQDSVARRAGAIRTDAVGTRTTLLLCRFRFDIKTKRGGEEESQIAEDCGLLAFEGAPSSAAWLDPEGAEALIAVTPSANINADQASDFVRRVIEGFSHLTAHLDKEARRRAETLLESHRRVRQAPQIRGVSYRVEAQLPVDVLGIYVYLPARIANRERRMVGIE